jgi:nitrogen fixation protein
LVEHPHHFLQVLAGELRVARRGLDVEVPKVFLDGPQVPVRPAEQLGAAAMAKGMRVEFRHSKALTERLIVPAQGRS